MITEPTCDEINEIVLQLTEEHVLHADRFPTGLAHFVYDVTLSHGNHIVVRVTRPENRDEFASCLGWYPLLIECGVPLAMILASDLEGDWPVLILERLPGTDLQHVYPALSVDERRTLALEIAAIQLRVGLLPHGTGFGYAAGYDDPDLNTTWLDELQAQIDHSRRRISEARIVDAIVCDRVEAAFVLFADYLDSVQPVAFLDDTTTKNVLVHKGRLSGIVDVDRVCFGDPLFTLALTRMAILSRDWPDDYVWAWFDAAAYPDSVRPILDLYTAIFACGFLSEFGHAFNRSEPGRIAKPEIKRILSVLDEMLSA